MVQVTSSPIEERKPSPPQPPSPNQCDDDKNHSHGVMTDQDIKEFIRNFQNLPSCTEDTLQVLLQMLATAITLEKKHLASQIAHIVASKIDKHNALTILRKVPTRMNEECRNFEPSAPPAVESDNQEALDAWVSELTDSLRHNCFVEIERNADFVLQKDEILTLNRQDLEKVLSSDTLRITSELDVYRVILKWARAECKRRAVDFGSTNVRGILKELVYCPRYGLMSEKDFLCRTVEEFKGPDRSDVLEEQETKRILSYIKNRRRSHNPDELPHKASMPRKTRAESKRVLEGGKKSEKLVLNFLTCFTAVFD